VAQPRRPDPARAGLDAREIPRIVVVLDSDADLTDLDACLFHWVANADFGRDLHTWRNEAGRVGRLGFDSTRTGPGDERDAEGVRPWPPIAALRCSRGSTRGPLKKAFLRFAGTPAVQRFPRGVRRNARFASRRPFFVISGSASADRRWACSTIRT
jgi:hypothetical protein